MNPRKRKEFDEQVRRVLDRFPRAILRLLREVPLHVEDHPPAWLRRKMRIAHPCGLMGCFSGIPLDSRYRRGDGHLTMIMIYRDGILEASRGENGRIRMRDLREQIRVTILHELGHYHGMDEGELEDIGYG